MISIPSGAVLYTVTATGDIDNPTVTFNVPASATKTYISGTKTWIDGGRQHNNAEEITLQFTGITPGYYYLHETKAPDGYILTTANGWHFQVGESGIIQGVGDFTDDGTFEYVDAKKVTVSNTPGASLPYTGGPGTRLFTILGSILILGAGVLLWRRRRLI